MFFYVCNGRWPGATHSANPDGRNVEEKKGRTPLSRSEFEDGREEYTETRTWKGCKRGSEMHIFKLYHKDVSHVFQMSSCLLTNEENVCEAMIWLM